MLQYLVICFPFFCITHFPHWKAALMVLNSACFKKNLFIFRPHWIFVAWIFQLQLWVSSSLQGTGFSLWWLLLLWSTCCRGARTSVLVVHGLSYPTQNLPEPGNWTCVSCTGRQILNHWTTREVPNGTFLTW